jgi:hypothetical protein
MRRLLVAAIAGIGTLAPAAPAPAATGIVAVRCHVFAVAARVEGGTLTLTADVEQPFLHHESPRLATATRLGGSISPLAGRYRGGPICTRVKPARRHDLGGMTSPYDLAKPLIANCYDTIHSSRDFARLTVTVELRHLASGRTVVYVDARGSTMVFIRLGPGEAGGALRYAPAYCTSTLLP